MARIVNRMVVNFFTNWWVQPYSLPDDSGGFDPERAFRFQPPATGELPPKSFTYQTVPFVSC
jgi:hypothetical protein